MQIVKKILLALGLAGALGLSASAGAVTITDIANPTDRLLTAGSYNDDYSYSHNIRDERQAAGINSNSYGNYDITAVLTLYLRDDSNNDGGERYTLALVISGTDQTFTNQNDLSTPNFSLNTNAIADLLADDTLNVTIQATQGDFYFEKSVLAVTFTAKQQQPGGQVPEPATLAMLGLGLLGLGAARRKAGKKD